MSFNRPEYLRPVLASLAAQEDAEISDREIFLFQDGEENAYSGKVYAAKAQIDECVAIFREFFPQGNVLRSEKNIGVAENFLRAEKLFFEDLESECAYFFEDDMVLLPRYLNTLDRVRDACAATDLVGYFACYGGLTLAADVQRKYLRKVQHIDHFWGFGLFRRHWQDMQPHMATYYNLVVGRDYRARPHEEIINSCRANGIPVVVSSQDDVKLSVTNKIGRTCINTVVVNARYIGAKGLHFNQKFYDNAGFARTETLDLNRIEFDFPSEAELAAMRDKFTRNRRRKIEAELAQSATAAAANVLPLPRMSQAELALLMRVLSSGRLRYAEFGAGGSTRLAALAGFDAMVSVESDAASAQKVRSDPAVAEKIAAGKADVLHADIGPVGAWGAPVDRTSAEKWPTYLARMWDQWAIRKAFPDLVLVSGRFRVASCLSVALLAATRPAGGQPPLVLIHDMSDARPGYKLVFEAFRVIEHVDTLCLMTPRADVSPERTLALMLSRLAQIH
jgi:hypothetical protein